MEEFRQAIKRLSQFSDGANGPSGGNGPSEGNGAIGKDGPSSDINGSNGPKSANGSIGTIGPNGPNNANGTIGTNGPKGLFSRGKKLSRSSKSMGPKNVSTSAGSTAYEAISTLNSNEKMLIELFEGIDFNHTGTIDYSEFLAACLARKEGMKREYAELIFDL